MDTIMRNNQSYDDAQSNTSLKPIQRVAMKSKPMVMVYRMNYSIMGFLCGWGLLPITSCSSRFERNTINANLNN